MINHSLLIDVIYKVFLINLVIFFITWPVVHAECNATIPKNFQLPKIRSGKDYTVFDDTLSFAYHNKPVWFESLLKHHVAEYNNISGSIIQFPTGQKAVYRSGMLAYSPITLEELVKERSVKSIVHLSNKKIVDQKAWTSLEKNIFKSFGGNINNYIHILDFDYVFNDNDELSNGQKKVAEIIHKIEALEGNVLIHCLGGEHKTELVFEVMQKCYNHVDMENIIERYKCHTAYSPNPNRKSGYKQDNVDFIKNYPCAILRIPEEDRS